MILQHGQSSPKVTEWSLEENVWGSCSDVPTVYLPNEQEIEKSQSFESLESKIANMLQKIA